MSHKRNATTPVSPMISPPAAARKWRHCLVAALFLACTPLFIERAVAKMTLADNGTSDAVICVDDAAGQPSSGRQWERRAADDLALYIERMTGATIPVVAETEALNATLSGDGPLLIVGELALREKPALRQTLKRVAKADPVIRADAIVVQRDGNRVYLAGTNDSSHYHAAAWLLHQWGCRWYMPTEFGECIPERDTLEIGRLNHAYAPPFEVRGYWIAWNGSREGAQEFQHRNFMNGQRFAGQGHALSRYTKDLIEKYGSWHHVPFSHPATAEAVVEAMKPKMEEKPEHGISLAINDGSYTNDYELDQKLQADLYDKFMLKPSMTDPMMRLYENVARLLDKRYPDNDTKIGGMAYSNVTIPPQWDHEISDRLVMWLAPIDIDPNHGMNDPASPPRQEYKHMMHRWAELMDGRVCIYDYDQGMLVWRDIPNPSHQAFVQDVKEYRDAGILGISTESRGAIATVFTNLHIRGQLMWDPDADVQAILEQFYDDFYGPAAEPAARFWNAIFEAWDETIVTEHEYFAAPAIYTPELMKELRRAVKQAVKAIGPLEKTPADQRSQNENLYVRRMEALRLQWAVLDGYISMVHAGATDCDYETASKVGRKAIADRLDLARMNPTFTTRIAGRAAMPQDPEKANPAWFAGEVGQYLDLAKATNGAAGTLIKKLPLEWAFRRDPNDTGLASGWAYRDADLAHWRKHKTDYDIRSRKDYPATEWEMLPTNLYVQAQGIRHPDRQSFTGYLWYKTDVKLSRGDRDGPVHVRFPGLFNDSWLYVNGKLVAHRDQKSLWWRNNYAFEWDVDLTDHLDTGANDITLRCHNIHHMGGMFRRPFLYRPAETAAD